MSKRLSAKNKIIIIGILLVVLSLLNFTYFFKILDASNQKILDSMAKDKKGLAVLLAEQQSEAQAQYDLQELAKKPLQPEDFFSRDITLVNEIKILENLEEKLGVKMSLSGVSGTIKSAAPANTVTPLVVIPYNIGVTGSLNRVVDFIETLENLNFVTNVSNISLSSADQGNVSAGMTASFYLRKN